MSMTKARREKKKQLRAMVKAEKLKTIEAYRKSIDSFFRIKSESDDFEEALFNFKWVEENRFILKSTSIKELVAFCNEYNII